MTTKTTNRLKFFLAADEARRWGTAAAIFNEPTNPYPPSSELACIWQSAFNAQLAVIAAREGTLAAGEAEADARDAKPVSILGWFKSLWDSFTNWGGK